MNPARRTGRHRREARRDLARRWRHDRGERQEVRILHVDWLRSADAHLEVPGQRGVRSRHAATDRERRARSAAVPATARDRIRRWHEHRRTPATSVANGSPGQPRCRPWRSHTQRRADYVSADSDPHGGADNPPTSHRHRRPRRPADADPDAATDAPPTPLPTPTPLAADAERRQRRAGRDAAGPRDQLAARCGDHDRMAGRPQVASADVQADGRFATLIRIPQGATPGVTYKITASGGGRTATSDVVIAFAPTLTILATFPPAPARRWRTQAPDGRRTATTRCCSTDARSVAARRAAPARCSARPVGIQRSSFR